MSRGAVIAAVAVMLAACASGPRGFDDDFAGVKAKPLAVALGCKEPKLVYRALTWPGPITLPHSPVTITVPYKASTTHGAVQGRVVDKTTGKPLGDVTVVATSPALEGSSSELTGRDGGYKLDNLPPGNYEVVFYYGEFKIRQTGVKVSAGSVTPVFVRIDPTAVPGEVIDIHQKAPNVDFGDIGPPPHQPIWVDGEMPDFPSGVRIQQEYTKAIPVAAQEYIVPRDPRADRLCNP